MEWVEIAIVATPIVVLPVAMFARITVQPAVASNVAQTMLLYVVVKITDVAQQAIPVAMDIVALAFSDLLS